MGVHVPLWQTLSDFFPLSENVQEMLRDKKLTEGHAKVLAGVADKDTQEKACHRVYRKGLDGKRA